MSRYNEGEDKVRSYHKMTLEQLQAELNRETREAVQRELEKVGGTVDRVVSQTVLLMVQSLTGFKKDNWGRWEYEGGDKTKVAQFIEERAEEAVEKHLMPAIETFVTEIPKAAIKQAQKSYNEAFNYAFASRLREIAEQRAEEAANELAESLYPRKKEQP